MADPAERIREIQEEMARRAAQPEESEQGTETVLLFTLSEEQYAFPLAAVREVSRVGAITPLPGLHPAVLGASGLRGEVLAVLDLRRLLGLEEQPLTPDSRLLVVQHGEITAALLADGVADIAALPTEALLPPPDAEEVVSFLQAIARDGRTTIRLLDPARLLEAVCHAQ